MSYNQMLNAATDIIVTDIIVIDNRQLSLTKVRTRLLPPDPDPARDARAQIPAKTRAEIPAEIKAGHRVGCLAPDFELKDDNGNPWRLSRQRGKVVALIFYPKDETPVCTKQLCSMRDRWSEYQSTGAEVVAVSVGSVESHRNFAQHHSLPMPILADEHLEITKLLDVKFVFGNISQRAVIVIDKDGVIRYRRSVLPIFRPTDDEVIAMIKSASAT
ncbi:MAG: peroxiredoxin family protein [Blastocatellia bacterium]